MKTEIRQTSKLSKCHLRKLQGFIAVNRVLQASPDNTRVLSAIVFSFLNSVSDFIQYNYVAGAEVPRDRMIIFLC